MKKIVGSVVASLILALSFVSFSAAETSQTYYEKENGVWTGVSNQYVYSNDVLKVRVKRTYDANGKIKSKVEYEYVNGLYNGVSTEVLYDSNGKMTKKVKRSYSGKGVLVNQVEYGYKNGVWDGTSNEISYNSDSSRNRVTKRTYNSAGKLQYRSEFLYGEYLRESYHYEYNTSTGKLNKEVYRKYNQNGVKITEEESPYVNGKWTGVRHTSDFNPRTGAKEIRSTRTYNGKGQLVHEIAYQNVSNTVGWKKGSEMKYVDGEVVSGEIIGYDCNTGHIILYGTQTAIKNGEYSTTLKYYNSQGVIVKKEESFFRAGELRYLSKEYYYTNGKWDGNITVKNYDSEGNKTTEKVVKG